ncbi:glutamate decarboxylase [Laetiporus sulphureus 93-53]|uniref:Glutamate decarboxylase n=1 Tax=Laetiporus sulphureus 93-53 TaxID=1314785 RepID=A0A165BVL7_9APHY|nr:glutamate decarboxylase [Laetiporus sulphureus 93-53]KZT01734.1 glutamate decarboxylase [Laetiporus sulphureus 93-53]
MTLIGPAGWLAMTYYYATAFRTGVYPAIMQDQLYLWARPRAKDASTWNDMIGPPTNYQLGTDAEATYQLLHDERSLDGIPLLNLASFVHTWMPKQADQLMMANIGKNLIDQDEYPMTRAHEHAIGTATTGSYEAIQSGGPAMKRIWQEKRKAEGKSIHDPGPNIVMGANAQVALEKFARYFDVEARLVPISEESHYRLDPKKAMEYIDENTIGVYVILGSTYTGYHKPVEEMAELLDEYEARTGHSVPIHVDGASGGFIAPFATPKLEWDFRIPRVVSINTSGHKFGLSYVGVGWVVWRSQKFLPKDLIFELQYLRSVEYSASDHCAVFNFVHLGWEAYRAVTLADLKNARLLSRVLEKSGLFVVLSDIHWPAESMLGAAKQAVGLGFDEENVESYVPGLPVVSFRFSEEYRQKNPGVQQRWVQTLLRARSWIVPNYELAPTLQDVEILRVVVRENLSA